MEAHRCYFFWRDSADTPECKRCQYFFRSVWPRRCDWRRSIRQYRTHYFTASALTNVTLQFASAESVAATLASSSNAAQFYSRWIWRLSCRITDHLAQSKTLSAADRLLILLTSLGTLAGERYRDGILVQIESDVTLADLLNLEAPNFSRTKRTLIQEGKIVQHGRIYRLRSQTTKGHAAQCRMMDTNIYPIII